MHKKLCISERLCLKEGGTEEGTEGRKEGLIEGRKEEGRG
jgi:hypothetical protein